MPLTERKLIDRIRRSAGRSGRGGSLVKGIGDDCAVLRVPGGHELLVTTDFTLENVHFRREWQSPELVGGRCLTRGLSDIAAMGGEPRAVFLSLAVDREAPQKWVDGFLRGLLALAKEFGVPLAGGDTAQSAGGIQADIVVVGSVPAGKAVLRSGAKPGDSVYVTGKLGGAAAALARLMESKPVREIRPQPRIAAGQWLRRSGIASAMIDLSDGLSTDLDHICCESRVGAEIEAAEIPRARLAAGEGPVTLEMALHGGEDYELLFTSKSAVPAKIAEVSITRIGRITARRGIRLVDANGKSRMLQPRGWEHFRNDQRDA